MTILAPDPVPLLEWPVLSGLVLLDCDGVLLHWWAGFGEWLRRTRGIKTDPGGPSCFGMADWTGIHDRGTMLALIEEFNGTPGSGFAELRPVPGAVEAVEALKAAGLSLHVITACSSDPRVRAARIINLEAVFGPVFDRVTCVGMLDSKDDVLRAYPPSIWIDDTLKHARAGRAAGHHALLMTDSHNLHDHDLCREEGIPVIEGWAQVSRALALPQGLSLG